MGLSNNDDNLVAKLYKEKKIPNKLFSLCFGYDGGSMSIGVPDTARHKGKIAYAKLGPDPTRSHFYNVMLRDVRIGNDTIDAPAKSYSQGHFIVDSGTTDSYLPSSMKAAFEAAFEKVTGLKYQASGAGCKGYTDEDLDALPNIQIVLEAEDGGDLVLEVTPDQYLIQESGGHYCASVFLTEFSGGVIGANIMTDRDVIFDSGSQRVGFVDADCAYSNATAPSSAPRDKPAPGVVASSNVDTSKTSPTPNPSPKHVLPPAPTLTPVPSPTPGLKPTVAPTTAPTPKPTLRPTVAPSPIPVAASVDFDTESSKSSSESAPVLTPVPESTATTSTTHLNHANNATPSPVTPSSATPTPFHTPASAYTPAPVTPDPHTLVPASVTTSRTPAPLTSVTTLPTTALEPKPTTSPVPTSSEAHSTDNRVNASATNTKADGGKPFPVLLTIFSTILAAGLVLVIAVVIRRRRHRADFLWEELSAPDEEEGDNGNRNHSPKRSFVMPHFLLLSPPLPDTQVRIHYCEASEEVLFDRHSPQIVAL
ncbi:Aspartyl protease, partial [Globisporangium splendens]